MDSFEQLIINTENLYDDELKEYFEDYFTSETLDTYLIEDGISLDDESSIKEMFTSDEPILSRAFNVHEKNPYCLEANYVIYGIGADETVSDYFKTMYERSDEYNSLDDYRKKCYIWLLQFYGEYLLDIHSIKKAIKVVKKKMELNFSCSLLDVDRLAYMYCLIEEKDDFVELYKTIGFIEPLPYILLITVLLKCDDEELAKEVFDDLVGRYEHASYIDHLWDLDGTDDEEAIEFIKAVEASFEEICSVPHFFDWCARNKEDIYRS